MKIIPKLLFGSALVSLIVVAADIPEALPAGFLEKLPVMLEMDDAEYAAFLAFSQQPPKQRKKHPQGERNDDQ